GTIAIKARINLAFFPNGGCEAGAINTPPPRSTVAARASKCSAYAARRGIVWHHLAPSGSDRRRASRAEMVVAQGFDVTLVVRKQKARLHLAAGLCQKRVMGFEPTTFTLAT